VTTMDPPDPYDAALAWRRDAQSDAWDEYDWLEAGDVMRFHLARGPHRASVTVCGEQRWGEVKITEMGLLQGRACATSRPYDGKDWA